MSTKEENPLGLVSVIAGKLSRQLATVSRAERRGLAVAIVARLALNCARADRSMTTLDRLSGMFGREFDSAARILEAGTILTTEKGELKFAIAGRVTRAFLLIWVDVRRQNIRLIESMSTAIMSRVTVDGRRKESRQTTKDPVG